MAADLADRMSHYLTLDSMPWEQSRFPGIEVKILMHDAASGMSTMLLRMAPGAVVPHHEHQGIEQTYVFEGSLEDEEGACTAGNFVWRRAGSVHTACAPNGALLLSFFAKPNRFFEGQKFFTEEG